MYVLGIDTSNYTTSAALVDEDENIIFDRRRLLEVKKGERGLRQQEALFQHVKNLPDLIREIMNEDIRERIIAVAVSTRPRPVEGSYMPCFLAGEGTASSIASALGVPLYRFSHQEGHVAAVAPPVLKDFLCYHLSGGTGELLKVHIRDDADSGICMDIEIIGATKDISPGQLIDRTGVAMGYGFPAGSAMDEIACSGDCLSNDLLTGIRLDGLDFSLSGMENQILKRLDEYSYDSDIEKRLVCEMFKRLSVMLVKLTEKARKETGIRDVVFAGGVSMSRYVREYLNRYLKNIYFGDNSADNAVGIALLGARNVLQIKGNSR